MTGSSSAASPATPPDPSDLRAHRRLAPLRRSRGLVVTLGILSACGPMAIDMYLPAFPQMAAELGVSIAQVQWTLSAFLLGLAAGQVLYGTLSDHLGRRGPLLVGCLAYTAAGGVCVFAESITWLIGARFLMGLGGSAGVVISRAIVRDLFDQTQAARYLSLLMIIGGIAPIVAPFLGGVMLEYFPWRTIFWAVAGFGVVCLVMVWRVARETLPPERRLHGNLAAVGIRYARLIVDRRFLTPALAFGMGFGALFTYITGSSGVFQGLYGVSPQAFSYFFAVNAFGSYAGGQFNRVLLRWFDVRTILPTACVANAVLTLGLLVVVAGGVGGLWTFAIVLCLSMASLSMVFPNATAVAMSPFARQAGTASALLGVFQYTLGGLAGGLLGMIAHDTAGGDSALPMAAIIFTCSAIGCAVYLLGRQRERQN